MCTEFTIYKRISNRSYKKNNNYKNLFFIFVIYITLTAKLNGKTLAKKHICHFFPEEGIKDKITLKFKQLK